MSVRFKHRRFDAQAEMNTAPSVWIADNIPIPENQWVLVPTAKVPEKHGTLDDMMDEIEQWHGFQVYSQDGEVIRGSDTRMTDDIQAVETLELVSGAMQGFLCFFPAAGETVWLRSRGRYETTVYDDEVNMERNTEGKLVLMEPPTPALTDPFRFVGTAERDKPFIVGPFTRNGSVWIRSTAAIDVCWATFPGRSTGLSITTE